MAGDALWPSGRQCKELEGLKAEVREGSPQTHHHRPRVLPSACADATLGPGPASAAPVPQTPKQLHLGQQRPRVTCGRCQTNKKMSLDTKCQSKGESANRQSLFGKQLGVHLQNRRFIYPANPSSIPGRSPMSTPFMGISRHSFTDRRWNRPMAVCSDGGLLHSC